MRKILALLLLFVGTLAFAQTSNLTATVTDSDTQTWNNGTYTISFVPPSGYTGSIYTFNGSPWTPPTPITGALSGSGVFTYNGLPRNDYILPVGSHWQFTFQPMASFGPSSTQLFVNNGTMNIGSSLVLVGPRFPAGNLYGLAYGYLDVEIKPAAGIGQFYWDGTLDCQRIWNGTEWACNNGNASIPTCSANQIAYYNSNGSVQACLAMGSGLSIDARTLNATGVQGTGTVGVIPIWDGVHSLSNSIISYEGDTLTINANSGNIVLQSTTSSTLKIGDENLEADAFDMLFHSPVVQFDELTGVGT